jgi:hypothetical protein
MAVGACLSQGVVVICASVTGRKAKRRDEPPRDLEAAPATCLSQGVVVICASVLDREAKCRDKPPRDLETTIATSAAQGPVTTGARNSGAVCEPPYILKVAIGTCAAQGIHPCVWHIAELLYESLGNV